MSSMDEANAASVAIVAEGQVLLIQRAFAPYAGLWTLPGGRREPGESIEACAIREIGEEIGLEIAALQSVVTMSLAEGRFRLAVFATRRAQGLVTPSDEIRDWRWIAPDTLGGLAVTPDLDSVLQRALAVLGAEDPGAQ